MKKILIVACDGLTKSGVPTTFMNIIRGLNMFFNFDVLYFDKKDSFYKDEILELGGKAIYCPIDSTKTSKIKKLLAKFKFKKIIKKVIIENGPYDVIHSFKGFESGYIMKAASELKIPIRISHKTFVYRKTKNLIVNLIEKKELKLTIKYSTLIIADSFKSLNNPLNLSKKGIVIKTYIDKRFLRFSELSDDNRPISFVQVGSYCNNKNQLFSLEVFEHVLQKYPDSVLRFVGFRNPDDYLYLDRLKQKIEDKGLTDKVEFYEPDANLQELFNKTNYLLFPSFFESFGIVPVEAQFAGLNCFCSENITPESDCGGNYYLPLDPEIWSEKIIECFSKSKGAHKIFDCSEFEKENVIDRYFNIYNGMTGVNR